MAADGASDPLDTLDTDDTPGLEAYAILDVGPTATAAEVRLAYLQKVREYPPERDPSGFKRIRAAYETLRSPRKRAELTLLELGDLSTTFDPEALREVPPPPLPAAFVDHLLAAALAEVDAAVDRDVARLGAPAGTAGAQSSPSSPGAPGTPPRSAPGGDRHLGARPVHASR